MWAPGRQMQFTEQFDVVVVGAGHAGCEVEPVCGRERSGSPQAILSGAKDLAQAKRSKCGSQNSMT